MIQESQGRRSIVSSAHLVSERAAELSEFEFGLIIASHAFDRWVVRCMAAAGQEDLARLDGLVLHTVNHRARDKKLADICFVLNVEDAHTVSYALKKLARLDLVEGTRRGKEIHYSTTAKGRDTCERYRQVREDCLVTALKVFAGQRDGEVNRQIGDLAEVLRALSGIYEQASRAATSL